MQDGKHAAGLAHRVGANLDVWRYSTDFVDSDDAVDCMLAIEFNRRVRRGIFPRRGRGSHSSKIAMEFLTSSRPYRAGLR